MVFLTPLQNKKIKVILAVFIVISLAIVVLLFKWQVFDSARFIAIADARYQDVKIPSVRGSILAADGSTLAYSEPRFDTFVWLPELESAEQRGDQTRQEFYTKVSNILGMTESAGLVSIEPLAVPRNPLSCGLPLPFSEVYAVRLGPDERRVYDAVSEFAFRYLGRGGRADQLDLADVNPVFLLDRDGHVHDLFGGIVMEFGFDLGGQQAMIAVKRL